MAVADGEIAAQNSAESLARTESAADRRERGILDEDASGSIQAGARACGSELRRRSVDKPCWTLKAKAKALDGRRSEAQFAVNASRSLESRNAGN